MKAKLLGNNRAIISLATILSFRMLGLFMIFPVFALYAAQYQYATPSLIGLALGIYGLTQGLLQLPLSMISDKIGRRPVILIGLVIFALGSLIAGFSPNIYFLIFGRALQGAGAIGSTLIALAADLTPVENRTKAMAILGMTIGLSFGIAMVIGPLINAWFHLSGIFWLTTLFALTGMAILYFFVPIPPKLVTYHAESDLLHTLKHLFQQPQLLKLNISILVLHMILTASFTGIPLLFKNLAIPSSDQWQIYLPILLGSFVTTLPLLFFAEKKNQIKIALLLGILIMIVAELLLFNYPFNKMRILFALYIFFTGFTLLEALLPSLISKLSPAHQKGTAMGLYSSFQFLGIFLGGSLAGLMTSHSPFFTIFISSAALCFLWFLVMLGMKAPPTFKTKIITLTQNITKQKAHQIAKQLLGLPGVMDAEISIEDCIAYLKVDLKIFDQQSLEKEGFVSV